MNIVSLVGRPNTGKSALFNRLAKKRVAIVFDQPGVTRDRVTRQVDLNGRKVMLVDTGGIAFDKRVTKDPLDSETRAQAALAVEDSSVCVIVVDSREGITPLDSEVIKRVRESGVPCVIAANKCDTSNDDWRASEFERFGLKVFAVSAEHSRGIDALVEAVTSALPPAVEDESHIRPLRVAIVGRPNAGKSSYINRLLNAPRVIVSDIPGTTRDAVEVPFTIGSGPEARHYMLVDTAGMKPHTKMSKTSVDNFSLFRSEQAIEEADVAVLLLDSKMGPTMQDKRIAGKILDAHKACILLMQKWDLGLEDGLTETKASEALRQMMPFLSFAPVVFCSNKSGYNIRRTIDAIDRSAASACQKIPTGMLNNVLVKAAKKTVAPMVRGKRLKIYYALQVSTNPQTIRLFVNDPKLATPAYLAYLERRIRERFGLEGAPLRLFLKARSHGSKEPRAQRAVDNLSGGLDGQA
ncbi:MAG: ribosome biogenesis GTPase Der [Kiritimatiellae bacterium]|nr:ribosome biogenesis GTPase Der [Kiritimatiellia bacterium]